MRKVVMAVALAMLFGQPTPGVAQVRTVDPNAGIDSDLAPTSEPSAPPARIPPPRTQAVPPPQRDIDAPQTATAAPPSAPVAAVPTIPADAARTEADAAAARGETFTKSELLTAAEGTFGQGAAGLAGILERTLKEQGYPNAYIAGREGSAAFAVGLRYGQGQLFHKIEGQQPVFWTGPSLGFDVGGDANKVFVLVYNLYDTEELFKRFPAAEGRLYFVGGFAATYLRRGNTVLIPIRLGVGWRQGVNIGYMKFSHKNRWFPL